MSHIVEDVDCDSLKQSSAARPHLWKLESVRWTPEDKTSPQIPSINATAFTNMLVFGVFINFHEKEEEGDTGKSHLSPFVSSMLLFVPSGLHWKPDGPH